MRSQFPSRCNFWILVWECWCEGSVVPSIWNQWRKKQWSPLNWLASGGDIRATQKFLHRSPLRSRGQLTNILFACLHRMLLHLSFFLHFFPNFFPASKNGGMVEVGTG